MPRGLKFLYLEYLKFYGRLCLGKNTRIINIKIRATSDNDRGRSLLDIKNKSGPETDHSGTPQFKIPASEKTLSTEMLFHFKKS